MNSQILTNTTQPGGSEKKARKRRRLFSEVCDLWRTVQSPKFSDTLVAADEKPFTLHQKSFAQAANRCARGARGRQRDRARHSGGEHGLGRSRPAFDGQITCRANYPVRLNIFQAIADFGERFRLSIRPAVYRQSQDRRAPGEAPYTFQPIAECALIAATSSSHRRQAKF